MAEARRRALVVGAGGAALAAARLLDHAGAQVTWALGGPAGGSLATRELTLGGWPVTVGLHAGLTLRTDAPDLDAVLYEPTVGMRPPPESRPREAHVFRGELGLGASPDGEVLGPTGLVRGLRDLRRRPERPGRHLAEALEARFGRTFRDGILRPFLEERLGRRLEALAPDAGIGLLPRHVRVSPGPRVGRLAQDPSFRDAIATAPAGSTDHPASLDPSIGRDWFEAGVAELLRRGIELRRGAVTELAEEKSGQMQAALDGGGTSRYHAVLWAAPHEALDAALGQRSPARTARDLVLLHVLLDAEPATDLQRVTFFDPETPVHRVLFHREARERPSGPERRLVTVELVVAPGEALPEDAAVLVARDLEIAGLVPRGTNVVASHEQRRPGAVPVSTLGADPALPTPGPLAVLRERVEPWCLPSALREADRTSAALLGQAPLSAQLRSAA